MNFHCHSKDLLTIVMIIVCAIAGTIAEIGTASGLPGIAGNEDTVPDKLEHLEGCPTNDGLFAVGQTKLLEGCAEMRCIKDDNGTVALIIVSCPGNPDGLPPRCKIIQKDEVQAFPECCSKVMICEKIVYFSQPTFVTSDNVSMLSKDEFEMLVLANQEPNHVNDVVPSSYMTYNRNPDMSGNDYDYMDSVYYEPSQSQEDPDISKIVQDKTLSKDMKKRRNQFLITE